MNWLLKIIFGDDPHFAAFLLQRKCPHDWVRTTDTDDRVKPHHLIARTATCKSCGYFIRVDFWTELPTRGLVSLIPRIRKASGK